MAQKTKLKKSGGKSEVDTVEKRKRLTIDLPATLHTQLKIAAAKKGITMAEIMCTLLKKQLKET